MSNEESEVPPQRLEARRRDIEKGYVINMLLNRVRVLVHSYGMNNKNKAGKPFLAENATCQDDGAEQKCYIIVS